MTHRHRPPLKKFCESAIQHTTAGRALGRIAKSRATGESKKRMVRDRASARTTEIRLDTSDQKWSGNGEVKSEDVFVRSMGRYLPSPFASYCSCELLLELPAPPRSLTRTEISGFITNSPELLAFGASGMVQFSGLWSGLRYSVENDGVSQLRKAGLLRGRRSDCGSMSASRYRDRLREGWR